MTLKSLLKRIILFVIPADNQLLYRLSKWYLDLYNNENNDDMRTNGELQLIRRILPLCTIVFDVGANVRNWTSLALTINPQLTVHCFEPSEATYQRLLNNRFSPSIICNNYGLSSTAVMSTLYVFGNGSGINSLYQRQGWEEGWGLSCPTCGEPVRLETLDGYCQRAKIQTIDFLKIDVEGHELEVLKGATNMLAKGGIRFIQFEYGGCNIDTKVLLKDFFEFFQPLPYTFHKICSKKLLRVERYDQRMENFQYQNWVVVKKNELL